MKTKHYLVFILTKYKIQVDFLKGRCLISPCRVKEGLLADAEKTG